MHHNVKKFATVDKYRGVQVVPGEGISQGSLVLRDVAVSKVPLHRTSTCWATLDRPGVDRLDRCSKCKVTHYCDRKAQVLDWQQHKHECKTLARFGLEKVKAMPSLAMLLARAMMQGQKHIDPDSSSLHEGLWCDISRLTRNQLRHVHRVAVAAMAIHSGFQHAGARCGKTNPPDTAAYTRMALALQWNIHTILDADRVPVAVGLFELGSLFNHSCSPNALTAFKGTELRVVASESIQLPCEGPVAGSTRSKAVPQGSALPQEGTASGVAGTATGSCDGQADEGRSPIAEDGCITEVCIGYIDTVRPASWRRRALRAAYGFECNCAECRGACAAWDQLARLRRCQEQEGLPREAAVQTDPVGVKLPGASAEPALVEEAAAGEPDLEHLSLPDSNYGIESDRATAVGSVESIAGANRLLKRSAAHLSKASITYLRREAALGGVLCPHCRREHDTVLPVRRPKASGGADAERPSLKQSIDALVDKSFLEKASSSMKQQVGDATLPPLCIQPIRLPGEQITSLARDLSSPDLDGAATSIGSIRAAASASSIDQAAAPASVPSSSARSASSTSRSGDFSWIDDWQQDGGRSGTHPQDTVCLRCWQSPFSSTNAELAAVYDETDPASGGPAEATVAWMAARLAEADRLAAHARECTDMAADPPRRHGVTVSEHASGRDEPRPRTTVATEAFAALCRCIAIRKQLLSPAHHLTTAAIRALGECCIAERQWGSALRCYTHVWAVRETASPSLSCTSSHTALDQGMDALRCAKLCDAAGRAPSEAARWARRALARLCAFETSAVDRSILDAARRIVRFAAVADAGARDFSGAAGGLADELD